MTKRRVLVGTGRLVLAFLAWVCASAMSGSLLLSVLFFVGGTVWMLDGYWPLKEDA